LGGRERSFERRRRQDEAAFTQPAASRVPALIVSPYLRGNFVVDRTQYDTTSILATIEERYGLAPLSSRDAAVHSLSSVFDAKQNEATK
jgi:phospholipase C